MLKGYRTYLSALAIVLHQVLNQLGLVDITGEQISAFVDVLLAMLALLFRYFANRGEAKGKDGLA